MKHILLTNDDGIDAPGLRALEEAFGRIPDLKVWTCAPDGQRSGCSHGMSLDRSITASERGPRRFAVNGLVADCVYFALFHLMPCPASIVVSGINRGPNLGSDVIYSGTVAGAREAVVRGINGLALSLVQGDDFSLAATSGVQLALSMLKDTSSGPSLLNVNFPAGNFLGPRQAPLGRRIYPRVVEQREAPISKKKYYWLGGPPVKDALIPGTDGHLIQNGIASATPLVLDQTDFIVLNEGLSLPERNTEDTP